jgi:hypothetical protein
MIVEPGTKIKGNNPNNAEISALYNKGIKAESALISDMNAETQIILELSINVKPI